MPRLKKNQYPSLRHHKASGRAVVTLNGKEYPCGKWGTCEANTRYNELISRWLARGRQPETIDLGWITLRELCTRYEDHTKSYFLKKDGTPNQHIRKIARVVNQMCKLFGSMSVDQFGTNEFEFVRPCWIKSDFSRTTCNDYATIMVAVFSWGVYKKLVPHQVVASLREVPRLKKGRTKASEPKKVLMVPLEDLEKAISLARPKYSRMMQVQLHTGMRPGEVCLMRPCDIDRKGKTWTYTPLTHKTQHHGIDRVIPIGPRSRAILESLIKNCSRETNYIFPASRSQGKKPCIESVYSRYIRILCSKEGIPHFSANRIRHTSLTLIRKRFSLEHSRVVAGHADANTTTIYAELDKVAMSEDVAENFG